MSELEEKLALLKQKQDHVDPFSAADVQTLVEGIEYAMSHGGDVSVAVTPVENGYKITVTDSEGVTQEATVQNGGDAYEVYKSTVPEGQTPMGKTEWLASLKGEKGDNAVNPFKGWYKTGDTLPTTGATGDYLYFKDTNETPAVTTIYRWNGSAFADTETEVDESHVQTFMSGQSLNAVKIKDASGQEVSGSADVLSAEAGKKLHADVFGGSYEVSEDIEFDNNKGYYNTKPGGTVVQIEDTYNPTPSTISTVQDNYRYLKLTIQQGEKYKVTHKSNGQAALRYVITDSEYTVLEVAESSNDLEIDTFEPSGNGEIIVFVNFYTSIANDFTGQSVIKYSQETVGGAVNEVAVNAGYVECETSADSSAKIVERSNFTLTKNVRLLVKFIHGNTAEAPTLNINNTGAKNMYIDGEVAGTLTEGEVLDCYYDGTKFQAKSITNTTTIKSLEKKILGTRSETSEDVTLDDGYYNTTDAVLNESYTPSISNNSSIAHTNKCKKIVVNANEGYIAVHRSGTSNAVKSYVITNADDKVIEIGGTNTGLITTIFSEGDSPYNVFINFYTPTSDNFSGMSLTKITANYTGGAFNNLKNNVTSEIASINFDLHGILEMGTFPPETSSTRIRKNIPIPSGHNIVELKVELESGDIAIPSYTIYKSNDSSTDLTGKEALATKIKLGEWYQIVNPNYSNIILYSATVENGQNTIYRYTIRNTKNVDNFIDNKSLSRNKMVVFGESISEFSWNPNNGGDGKSWTDHFSQMTGMNVINAAVGGSQYKQHAGIDAAGGLDTITLIKAVCSGNGENASVAIKQPSSETRTLANVSEVVENNTVSPYDSYTYKLKVTFTHNDSEREVEVYANSYDLTDTTLTYTSDYEIINTTPEWETVIKAAENTFTGIDRRNKMRNLMNVDWSTVDCVVLFSGSNEWNNLPLIGYPGYPTGDEDGHSRLGESGVESDFTTLGAFDKIVRLLSETYPHIKLYVVAPMVRYGDVPTFDINNSYDEGDVCMYTDKLYMFTEAHTGEWDNADIEEKTNNALNKRAKNVWCDNNIRGGYTLKQYKEYIINEAKKFYLPVLDMYDLGINRFNFSNSFLDTDNVHPYKAFKAIAARIAGFIKSHQAF